MWKKLIVGSMVASGAVALASAVDIAIGYPFARQITMDVMFLIGGSLVIYLGYDALQDLQ